MGGSKKQTVGYKYFMGLHFGLCHGPVDALLKIRGGDRDAWDGSMQPTMRRRVKTPEGEPTRPDEIIDFIPATGPVTSSGRITIHAPDLWGGEKKEGGIVGDLDVMMGEADQQPNDYLVSQLGEPMPAFRGMLSLVFRKGMVGAMNPYPKPWKFLVRRILKGWDSGEAWYPEAAPVSQGLSGTLAIYLALDGSGSMNSGFMGTLKDAVHNSLDYLALAVENSGVRVDIAITCWGDEPDTRISIIRRNIGPDQVAELKAWVTELPGRPPEGYWTVFPAGLVDLQEFYGGVPRSAERIGFFVTDGTPSGSSTLSQMQIAQAARALVDRIPGLRMHGINIVTSTTEYTAVVDNVSGGDIPIVSGQNPDEITNVILAALRPGYAMNPAHIAYEALTNHDWGLGYPPATIDDASFRSAALQFFAEGMGLCGQWTRQDTIEGFIQDVMNHAGAVLAQDPRTGLFRLLPIRGGYDPEALPKFRRGVNVVEVQNFERAAITEAVNEVTVQFNDMATGNKGSVTVQHLANIQAQGGVASQTVQYPLAPTAAIAQRLALRDLDAKAQPLCKARLLVDRTAYGILPGEVVTWTDDKLGIVDMPMRVLQVDYGSLTAGAIRLDLAEDVFGMPATTYMGQQPGGWEEPPTDPQPSPAAAAFEAPYLSIHRAEGASAAAALAPGSGFLAMVAAKAPGLNYGFTLYTATPGTGYEQTGTGEWAAGGILAEAVGPEDAALEVGAGYSLAALEPGDLAMLGDGPEAELVRIDATAPEDGVVSVGRGVGDTVPRAWPVGTRLWGIEDGGAVGATEYTEGETVYAKAATVGAGGEMLSLAPAPGGTVEMGARAARPYPPGRVRINGEAYPDGLHGELVIDWAHRDRLLQADQLVDSEADSIGPEPGTSYTLRAYLDGLLAETQEGITGTTATMTPGGNGLVRIELEAVRDGLASWHMHVREFPYTIGPTNERVTVLGDRRVTVAGNGRTTIG